MRKLFFVFAFMLIASFTYASSESANSETLSETKTTIIKNSIDFDTFISKFDLKTVNKDNIVFNIALGSFYYTDSCGNEWIVDYWGMSWYDAMMIVYELDDFLCLF